MLQKQSVSYNNTLRVLQRLRNQNKNNYCTHKFNLQPKYQYYTVISSVIQIYKNSVKMWRIVKNLLFILKPQ